MKFLSGEIYSADLEPVRGSEQGKMRPVAILQNPDLSRFTTTALCIPLTSNLKRLGLPGTCLIKCGASGLSTDSIALAFQMRALDVSRLRRRLGRLTPPALEDLADAALSALGIDIE
ncbi:MAG: mRNA interferase [Elusimicrobia bacterium]|nr:MAG: mRNA interferase [Elusimicrobiota bacterium]KAF0158208.1 MAG: mRNA interferase [Elusimicrobiota bacterium]